MGDSHGQLIYDDGYTAGYQARGQEDEQLIRELVGSLREANSELLEHGVTDFELRETLAKAQSRLGGKA